MFELNGRDPQVVNRLLQMVFEDEGRNDSRRNRTSEQKDEVVIERVNKYLKEIYNQ